MKKYNPDTLDEEQVLYIAKKPKDREDATKLISVYKLKKAWSISSEFTKLAARLTTTITLYNSIALCVGAEMREEMLWANLVGILFTGSLFRADNEYHKDQMELKAKQDSQTPEMN